MKGFDSYFSPYPNNPVSRGVGSVRQSTPADFGLPAPGGDNEMGLNATYNNYADYAEDMEQASKMGELVTYELDQVYAHVHETRMGGQSMKEITGYSFHFNTKRVKYSSNSSGNWLSSPVGAASTPDFSLICCPKNLPDGSQVGN